jgi:hypothetical protein
VPAELNLDVFADGFDSTWYVGAPGKGVEIVFVFIRDEISSSSNPKRKSPQARSGWRKKIGLVNPSPSYAKKNYGTAKRRLPVGRFVMVHADLYYYCMR